MKRSKLQTGAAVLLLGATVILAGCGGAAPSGSNGGGSPAAAALAKTEPGVCDAKNLDEMVTKAKAEGAIVSYGMPDDWANWKENWEKFTAKYGLKHTDTDMSSADELAKFLAEKDKPVADVGDIGIAFGPQGKAKGASGAYKFARWSEVPAGVKDPEGYWTSAYQGTMVFMVNTKKAPFVPKTFKDLLDPRLKGMVSTSDPMKASQGQAAVMAAAFANGGDETGDKAGIEFWNQLVKQGNYKQMDVLAANWQKGELTVGVMWDFNAINYRDKVGMQNDLQIVVPEDATISVPYAAVINKVAPHPCAARLWQEWLFSDEGQTILAKGAARPIVPGLKLPEEVKAKFPPDSAYQKARQPKDWEKYADTSKQVKADWESQVLPNIK